MTEILRKKGSLLTVRPDIRVLDATIRDGGLMNSFYFDDAFVKNVYDACIEAGVDYMEFGYKGSKEIFDKTKFGPWKFCDEADIRRIVGDNNSPLKIAVMADAERTDFHTDILPKADSVIDMVRVATYIHQLPTAIEMIEDAAQKGYETTVNIMAISHVPEKEIDEALRILCETPVNVIYLVDSFGSYYPEQIRELAEKYLTACEACGKSVGIHAHNNQQLAFANTIETLAMGASYLDATISSLGRGAGNCPMELLLGFLKNPKYDVRPMLKIIETHITELRNGGLVWGYDIPYLITGLLNVHPRSAIKYITEKSTQKYSEFYNDILEDQ